jgi:hypothetical protein
MKHIVNIEKGKAVDYVRVADFIKMIERYLEPDYPDEHSDAIYKVMKELKKQMLVEK